MTKARYLLPAALAGGLALGASLLGCFGLPSLLVYATTGRFQLTAKEYHEDTWKVSKGMTREEVLAMMGRPHERLEGHDGAETWLYSTSVFHCWGVRFDPEGQVVSTWVD